jgi:rare lipoprotein A
MNTPSSLVAVLRRKLDGPAAAPLVAPAMAAVAAPNRAKPPRDAAGMRTLVAAVPVAMAEAPRGKTLVQVGALASKTNAEATAAKIGGKLQQFGKLWLVRMGPYLARTEVTTALAKARGAGYSDARIQRVD